MRLASGCQRLASWARVGQACRGMARGLSSSMVERCRRRPHSLQLHRRVLRLLIARALGVAVPAPTLPGHLSTKLVMMVRRLKRCLQCWQETAGGSCLTSLGDDGDDDGDGIDDDDACVFFSRIPLSPVSLALGSCARRSAGARPCTP